MGEIIKKLSDIQLEGVPRLSIEVNTPNAWERTDSIHLHAGNTRLAMQESQFLALAFGLMVAKKQFDIIKTYSGDGETVCNQAYLKEYYASRVVEDFFALVNESDISYALMRNVGGELPNRLVIGKDIDLLVCPDDMTRINQVLLENNYLSNRDLIKDEPNPHYLYGLKEPVLYQNKTTGLCIHIADRLYCKSLTPNVWVPLDTELNREALKTRKWDGDIKCWRLGPSIDLTFLIVRCVFDKHFFANGYIEEIEQYQELLLTEHVRVLLSHVFFNFTDRLLELLREKSMIVLSASMLPFETIRL